MQDILEQIEFVIRDVGLEYTVVDIEGKMIYSTTDTHPKHISIDVYLADPKKDVLSVKKQGLLLGYIIFDEKLTEREGVLLNNIIRMVQEMHDADIEQKIRFDRTVFWKNYLYNRIRKQDLSVHLEKFDISTQSHYVILYVRFFPQQDLTQQQLDGICDRLKFYGKWQHARTQSILLRAGEGVIIVDLSDTPLENIVDTLRALRRQNDRIIRDIQKSILQQDERVIIGAGNPVSSIEDVPDMFAYVRDFIRAASKLYQYSRIILYEHIPLYTLMQHITTQEAGEFIDTALKGVHAEKNETIETLKALFESNLNVSAAAKELGVHRNTLEYRLKKIHEDTQLDPQMFFDGMQLYLALLLLELNSNRKK